MTPFSWQVGEYNIACSQPIDNPFLPMLFSLIIPANHPALAGHFPGHPIVPAALLVDEICNLVENHTHQALCSVSKVRFVAPVKPDMPVTVECQASNQTDYRFVCRVDGELVAKGILSSNLSGYPTPTFLKDDAANTHDAAALYEGLPHSGSMRLLDSVMSHTVSTIDCQAGNPNDNPLKRGNKVPVWAALEYAAQALALHGLLNAKNSAANPVIITAFVVSIKHMFCFAGSLGDTGKPLQVSARIVATQPGAASCEFILVNDDKPLALGQFSVAYR